MKAGRELDALIAEKVMGWVIEDDPRELKRLSQYSTQDVQVEPWYRRPGGGWQGYPPNYSTSIAVAWEVVEKADLWSLYGSIGDGPYRACIQFEDREGLMTADTAPLAICLAALKAKGVTGEQHG